MQTLPRGDIFGIPVRAVPMNTMIEAVDDWIQDDERQFICTVDVHALMESQHHSDIRTIYGSAAIVTPDGMPIVWFLRRHGHPEAERICGPDLMPALFRRSEERGYRHFLYGSTDETLGELRTKLEHEYPRAEIVGTYSPPFRALSPSEDNKVIGMLNEADPDIIWVGLGAPKQDRWMAMHRDQLRARVLIGVGGAFDMMAGKVNRAPRFIQRSGCEWMYRLVQEPRRLWWRYLRSNSEFVVRLCGEALHPSGRPRHA